MKYQTPEATVLASAIEAIQGPPKTGKPIESGEVHEGSAAYEDYE